jgi:multicomponent Na+:H+ antiporter subunit G
MLNVISYIIIGIGIFFMLVGVYGLFQPGKDFYYRILVGCKVDTVGLLTVGIGLAIRHGWSFFTGKIFLIVLIILVLNPLVAHLVARAAYKSGYVNDLMVNEDEEVVEK